MSFPVGHISPFVEMRDEDQARTKREKKGIRITSQPSHSTIAVASVSRMHLQVAHGFGGSISDTVNLARWRAAILGARTALARAWLAALRPARGPGAGDLDVTVDGAGHAERSSMNSWGLRRTLPARVARLPSPSLVPSHMPPVSILLLSCAALTVTASSSGHPSASRFPPSCPGAS